MVTISEELEDVSLEPGESVDITYGGVGVSLTYEVRHNDDPFAPTFRNIRAVRADTSEETTVDYGIWKDERRLAIRLIVERLFDVDGSEFEKDLMLFGDEYNT